MRIEETWLALEHDLEVAAPNTWLMRKASARPGPIHLAVQQGTNTRAVMVQCVPKDLPPSGQWPQCRGLELRSEKTSDGHYFTIILRDAQAADVFDSLIWDLLRRVDGQDDSEKVVSTVLHRLARWQRFLAAGSEGLSLPQQRGLYAELAILLEWAIPQLGPARAVAGWVGPSRAAHDFRIAGVAIEVKSTLERPPREIPVASVEQLDDTGMDALFLAVVVLASQRTGEIPHDAGESLVDMVATLRRTIAHLPDVLESFEDRLLQAGVLGRHESVYEEHRFTRRGCHVYLVRDGFPRLIHDSCPVGVRDVQYAIALSECQSYLSTEDAVLAALRGALL